MNRACGLRAQHVILRDVRVQFTRHGPAGAGRFCLMLAMRAFLGGTGGGWHSTGFRFSGAIGPSCPGP
jgi:hypothetical protein